MLTTTRTRSTVPLAALLLALQGLGGGAVPLAHATERFSAAAHIEARHDAACAILHDELRCALCFYAGARAHPIHSGSAVRIPARPERPVAARSAAAPPFRPQRRSSPRAPPVASV